MEQIQDVITQQQQQQQHYHIYVHVGGKLLGN
jgi:hypothetical protein